MNHIVTIQRTAKRWKACRGLGWLGILSGVALLFCGQAVGIILIGAGITTWSVGALGAYWTNG